MQTTQLYILLMVIMIGSGGVTHNTLEDVHSHWKRAEAVRIKCLGVPTLDMDNICFHLEVSISHISAKFHYSLANHGCSVLVGQDWREDYIPSYKYTPLVSWS